MRLQIRAGGHRQSVNHRLLSASNGSDDQYRSRAELRPSSLSIAEACATFSTTRRTVPFHVALLLAVVVLYLPVMVMNVIVEIIMTPLPGTLTNIPSSRAKHLRQAGAVASAMASDPSPAVVRRLLSADVGPLETERTTIRRGPMLQFSSFVLFLNLHLLGYPP